jgi:hypothetical protein
MRSNVQRVPGISSPEAYGSRLALAVIDDMMRALLGHREGGA